MNFFCRGNNICISFDETKTIEDVDKVLKIFTSSLGKKTLELNEVLNSAGKILYDSLQRKSKYLQAKVFNRYHSEMEMMRYLKNLERKDLSLTGSMIPLGSCTMKLNAATEMLSITLDEFTGLHPFSPSDQTQGYLEIIKDLEQWLASITGFKLFRFNKFWCAGRVFRLDGYKAILYSK